MDYGQPSFLYIDGHCSFCVRTGRLVEAIDSFSRIRVVSFRQGDSYRRHGFELADLTEEVHLVSGRQVFRGFDALIEVSRKIPWLWPALPALMLMRTSGLGPVLYRKVAASRTLALDGSRCGAQADCQRAMPALANQKREARVGK